jgi:geranylgeranyl reductase family protein
MWSGVAIHNSACGRWEDGAASSCSVASRDGGCVGGPEAFEVVVAGAGPAGAEAAYQLARRGRRVLLLERAVLPRDKPCGGGLTPKAYRALHIPERLVRSRITATYLQYGSWGRFGARAPGTGIWMVCRREFDQFLVERAAAAGADVRDGCAVRALEGVETPLQPILVRTTSGSIRAHAVVAADGAESAVARMAGLRAGGAIGAMVALEVEGRGESALGQTALLDYAVPRGYAWVFPKGELYNVGITSYDPPVGPRLRQLLARFTREAGVRFHAEPRAVGHRIPTWGPPTTPRRGRVLLAGDAAGLADPFFGEGIAYALLSGRLAAQAIDASLPGIVSDAYERSLTAAMGRPRKGLSTLARFVYGSPRLALTALRYMPPARRAALKVVLGAGLDEQLWGLQSYDDRCEDSPVLTPFAGREYP